MNQEPPRPPHQQATALAFGNGDASNAVVSGYSTISVAVNLDLIRRHAQEIRRQTNVPLLAVVKADAYGLGATSVAEAIADVVDGFCVFSLHEAHHARLWDIGKKRILVLGPPGKAEAQQYIAMHAQPAVSNIDDAKRLQAAVPVISVDTGMQRFTCPEDQIESVMAAGRCNEAFTHATKPGQAHHLMQWLGGRGFMLHAAGSALLNDPSCWLDAVRPGIALYRGATKVWTKLVEVKDSNRPAGYTGFVVPRFGVILCGYSHGLRAGRCSINGQSRRVLEVGMQSAFVEIGSEDRVGDDAVLLGDTVTEADLASAWGTTEHEVLIRLSSAGSCPFERR